MDSSGHRQRLRNRFSSRGIDSLQEYELIELLLTYAIPRRDVKPLAKLLTERFGDASGVVNASAQELLSVPGMGPGAVTFLVFIRSLLTKCLEKKLRKQKEINSVDDVGDFLRMKIGSGKKETLMVLYLDSRRHLIDYELYPGTVDHTSVYAREITERSLLCHACGIILAHNHPSGNCEPSEEDISLTRNLKETLARLGITLVDHVIVSPGECRSFARLLKDIPMPLNICAVCGDTPEKKELS
ncbi:MAG: DNA repair protein RadC [Lentisphaeria bacterium]|nr:DNA repair protein RadC [Lentisphaeria bacterium]